MVHNLSSVVEMRVPVIPLPTGEAQLTAGYTHVSRRPVAAVGAHGPPVVTLQDLNTSLAGSLSSLKDRNAL